MSLHASQPPFHLVKIVKYDDCIDYWRRVNVRSTRAIIMNNNRAMENERHWLLFGPRLPLAPDRAR